MKRAIKFPFNFLRCVHLVVWPFLIGHISQHFSDLFCSWLCTLSNFVVSYLTSFTMIQFDLSIGIPWRYCGLVPDHHDKVNQMNLCFLSAYKNYIYTKS